jgi:hypothetical protein
MFSLSPLETAVAPIFNWTFVNPTWAIKPELASSMSVSKITPLHKLSAPVGGITKNDPSGARAPVNKQPLPTGKDPVVLLLTGHKAFLLTGILVAMFSPY